LVPTRELAVQVEAVFDNFTDSCPDRIKSLAVFGGVSVNVQMMSLQNVNILVATPGRLIELVESKAVHLSDVKTLVLDEADKMLNLGFKEEMDTILSFLPQKRQNLLFSATLNDKVEDVTQILLREPIVVKIEPKKDYFELINQLSYKVEEEKKGPLLRYLIEKKELKQVLVFASSTFKVDAIVTKLKGHDIDAAGIHSKKSQGSRTDSLSKFKSGKLNVLVATDLLARGIDIEFLPCVINYELPRSPKDYVHRIGRTGRAENPGDAISFISLEEKNHWRVIQKKMKKWVIMEDSAELNF
jgi:ATP-dependent RNA helicase RhlE